MAIDQATAARWKALVGEGIQIDRSIKPQLDAIKATIEPRRSEIRAEIDVIECENGELQCCELCDAPTAVEDLIHGDDVSVCDACCKGLQAEDEAA